MVYAYYDPDNGQILGFYNSEFHTDIPEPNIEITEEEWERAVNGYYIVNHGELTEYKYTPTKEELIAKTQTEYARKLKELRDSYSAALALGQSEAANVISSQYATILNDFNDDIGRLNGEDIPENVHGGNTEFCPICGNLINNDKCTFCRYTK